MSGPLALSIVVIFHNMRREVERTLYSLSSEYQTGLKGDQYEVIAIENGSSEPILDTDLARFGPNFRYHFHPTDCPSPVTAVNLGIEMARGDYVAVIIDGARMASPGLVRHTIEAARRHNGALIGALAWHLGPDDQHYSIQRGYNADEEDTLLDSVGWKSSGYSLFSISSLDPSSAYGIKGGMPPELSYIALPATTFIELGGYDDRFRTPGGGFVNYDIVERALAQTAKRPVIIAGEGTFHQVHGGVSTNSSEANRPHDLFKAEYRAIKGRDFAPPERALPRYVGTVPQQASRFVAPLRKRVRRTVGALLSRYVPGILNAYRSGRNR